MADCYRPPEPQYDNSRRVSYPNATWHRQRSPPRGPSRPLGPVRSNTMDPDRDPRRKRQLSRSPDGAQARKQFKPGQNRDNATAQSNENSPRRSSISNGTPKHQSNGVGSSPGPQGRAQNSKDSSKDARTSLVNSPNSYASPMRDTSGRSTPLEKSKTNGASASSSKVAVTSKSTLSVNQAKGDATTTPDSILALLTSFSDEVAQQAALKISRDQAQARADRRQLEYNSTRNNFTAFPAIRERKTLDKEAAFKELGTRDEALKTHKASQTELMTTLATMISQNATRTDLVSRAEHNELVKELDKAKSLIETQLEQLVELNRHADDMRKASDDFDGRLTAHQKATDSAFKDVKEGLATYGSTVKTLATKDGLDKVEKKQITEHDQLDKKTKSLQADVAKLKAAAATSRDTSSSLSNDDKANVEKILLEAPAVIKDLGELKTTVDDVAMKVEDLKLRVGNDAVQTRLIGAGNSSTVAAVDSNAEHQSDELSDLQARLKAVEDDVAGFEEAAANRDVVISDWLGGEMKKMGNTEVEKVKLLHDQITNRIEDFASSQVSSDTFNTFKASMQVKLTSVEGDTKKLQTQLQKLQTVSQQSLVQPGPQPGPLQFSPSLRQMPNGVGHPQAPNGITRSPSLDNGPFPRNSSPHNTMQPPQVKVPDLQNMQMQLDQNTIVTQNIKQRMDNLTTDEMAKKAIDQMSQMYPHAKNLDIAISNLWEKVNQLKHDLSQELQARSTSTAKHDQQFKDTKKALDEVSLVALDAKKAAASIDMVELSGKLSTASESIWKAVKKTEIEMDAIKERLVECEAHNES